MDNLNKTSLFSLEVVVDNLTVRRPPADAGLAPEPALHKQAVSKDAHVVNPHYQTVGCCRFPTVAFRFLDFPTLLVNHVEASLAQTIKSKIHADPYYKVPLQLPELQDKDGNFVLKKGKSCLFKTTIETLLHHLSHTPLYVLITDTYPTVPKLIGNCVLPLDETMHLIYDDICKYGLSTPSTHGGKGTFKICNLMGSTVGSITFGYRLLSLGPGLLSHIPDMAIAKPVTDVEVTPADEITPAVEKETCKNASVATPVTKPHKQHSNINANLEKSLLKAIDRSTQTLKHRKSHAVDRTRNELKIAEHIDDDFFIANTVCPPPLFYNHEADVNLSPNTYSDRNVLQSVENLRSSSDSSFDEGTIRVEDRMSDDGDILHTKDDWDSKFAEHLSRHQEPRAISLDNAKAERNMPVMAQQAISQFPLLSALFSELMALNPNMKHDVTAVKKTVPLDTPQHQSQFQHKPVTEESTQQFLRRLSKPKSEIKSLGVNVAVKNIPQHRPSTTNNKHKTSLVCGMTNTQKLRLAKTNPDLLAELEKKEQKRVEQWRLLHARKFLKKTNEKEKPCDVFNALADGVVEFPDDKLSTVDGELHTKPVPTPRKSIRRLTEQLKSTDHNDASVVDSNVSKQSSAVSSIHVAAAAAPSVLESKKVYSSSSSVTSTGDSNDDASDMCSPLQNLLNVGSLVASGDDVTLQPTQTYSGIDEEAGIAYDFTRVNKLSMTGEQLRHSADVSESFEPELQKIIDNYDDDDDDDKGGDDRSESEPHSEISEQSEPSEKPPLSWSTDTRGITPRTLLASNSHAQRQVGALHRTAVVKPSARSLHSRSVSSGDDSHSPHAHYSDSFEESIGSMHSEHSDIPALGTMSDMKLATQAHFGYTWAHPN